MSLKDFFLRKMMERQLSGVPKEEQERVMKVVMENPELFKEIAEKIKARTGEGKDQMAAAVEVMGEYKDRLEGLLRPK